MVLAFEMEPFPHPQVREQSEVPHLVIGAAAEGGEHGEVFESELLEGVFEGLVEIGPILVGTEDEGLLAEPGAGSTTDRIQVADDRLGPQPQPRQMVGAGVGSEERLRVRGQVRESPGPTEGRAGHQHG